MYGRLAVLSGRSNRPLAEKICRCLGIELEDVQIQDYSNGNIEPNVRDSLRASDVFIVQSGAIACQPDREAAVGATSRSLVELLLLVDCAKDTAARVTAITPYSFYARGDKKDKPHIPIAGQLVARLIEAAGADRVMAMDLHAMQAQGFYRIPLDQVFGIPRMVDRLIETGLRRIGVLATDTGAVGRVRRFASFFRTRVNRVLLEEGHEPIEHIPIGVAEKRRFGDTERSEIINIVGGDSLKGMDVVMVDDEVLSGSTLVRNAAFLKGSLEPASITAAVTHGILPRDGLARLLESPIDRLLITDTVALDVEKASKSLGRPLAKVEIVSVADIFASAILNVHEGRSVSRQFEEP